MFLCCLLFSAVTRLILVVVTGIRLHTIKGFSWVSQLTLSQPRDWLTKNKNSTA